MRRKVYYILTLILLLVPFMLQNKAAAAGIIEGIRSAGTAVIPALFPYFVFGNLLLMSGFSFSSRMKRAFGKLFGVSGEGLTPFVFSLIGGYPLGIKTVSDLCREKKLTNTDAHKLLLFCNNTGPAFFLGVAGGKILGSTAAGVALYLIHTASAVLCGLLFRKPTRLNYTLSRNESPAVPIRQAIPQSILNACTSLLNISAFVIFFSAFCNSLEAFSLIRHIKLFLAAHLHIQIAIVNALASGILEMTSGILCLAPLASNSLKFSLLSLLITWGGMCVHFQALSQLSDTISTKGYYFAKLVQSLIAFSLSVPVGRLLFHESVSFRTLVPLLLVGLVLLMKIRSEKIIPKIPGKRGRNSEKNFV